MTLFTAMSIAPANANCISMDRMVYSIEIVTSDWPLISRIDQIVVMSLKGASFDVAVTVLEFPSQVTLLIKLSRIFSLA